MTRIMGIGCFIGLLLPVVAATRRETPPAPTHGNVVAFVDVHVIPMDRERVLDHQTVVVKDGRISAIGPTATTAIARTAVRIPGQDGYLLPGLADMHVHVNQESDLLLFVAHGVTTVRNLSGSPAHLDWRRRVEAGDLIGPRIFTSGPIIDGRPPFWPSNVVVETVAEADRIVAEQKAAGYDAIKIYSNLGREAYDAILAAAHRYRIRVTGHVPLSVGLEQALQSGQDCIEHLDTYAIATGGHVVSPDPLLASGVILARERDDVAMQYWAQRSREKGVWVCPTLVVARKVVPLDESIGLFARPEMRWVDPRMVASWDPLRDSRRRGFTPEHYQGLRRGDEFRLRMTKALQVAGVRLLLGTDTGNPFVVAGVSAHEELALLVAAGLTPFEALQTATTRPAQYLDTEDFGTVAVGRRADLVLVERNPFEDIVHLTHRLGVMAKGRWLPEADLRTQLEALALRSPVPINAAPAAALPSEVAPPP